MERERWELPDILMFQVRKKKAVSVPRIMSGVTSLQIFVFPNCIYLATQAGLGWKCNCIIRLGNDEFESNKGTLMCNNRSLSREADPVEKIM